MVKTKISSLLLSQHNTYFLVGILLTLALSVIFRLLKSLYPYIGLRDIDLLLVFAPSMPFCLAMFLLEELRKFIIRKTNYHNRIYEFIQAYFLW